MDALATIDQLKPLSQEDRMQALQNARDAVRASFGNAPERKFFEHENAERHPKSVRRWITGLCILVLVAAFALSAMRLYYIGSVTFAASIPDAVSTVIAGVATVLLAEAAQLVSTLALATFGQTRSARIILYATASGSTLIALVGNAQVALPNHVDNLFAYLDAFVPPLLVLGIGHVLKYQWMHSIEQHHEINQKYEAAFQTWQIATNVDTAKHPEWVSFYANALRDQIRRINARSSTTRNLCMQLDNEEWRALIEREMKADQWYVTAPQPVLVTREPAPQRVRTPRLTGGSPLRVIERKTPSVTGKSTDEVLDALKSTTTGQDSLLHVNCPYCTQEFINPNEKGLRLALTAHLRRCTKRAG